MLGKGEMMDMEHANQAGMPKAPMGIRISKTQIPAGYVTFIVVNTSKQMVHEMVLSAISDTSKSPPYNREISK